MDEKKQSGYNEMEDEILHPDEGEEYDEEKEGKVC